MKRFLFPLLALGLATSAAGCDDDDTSSTTVVPSDDGGIVDDGSIEPDVCPENAPEVIVTGSITSSTTWTCANTYILSGFVFVENGATLTVSKGTTVKGVSGAPSGTLIVTRGSRLVSNGTADEPVVFTSAQPVGERRPMDWGGIVLFGAGISNLGANVHFEGTPASDTRFDYGGTDNTHDCGSIRYTRVEFAGYEFAADKEFNGITLAACGSQTRVSYVQIHRGSDDGIEFFGGAANADHLVLSRNQDDALDWDNGFEGTLQNVIIWSQADGDNGIEADSIEAGTGALPISNPTISNITILGPGFGGGDNGKRGVLLRRHTRGLLVNGLVGYYTTHADVQGNATNDPDIATAWGEDFGLRSFSFFGGGAFPSTDDRFVDADLLPSTPGNDTTDPQIVFGSLTNPSFVPTNTALAAGVEPPAPLEATATYRGAVKPNATGADLWYAGWTSFADN